MVAKRSLALALLFTVGACATALRPTTGLRCEEDGRTRWVLHETPHARVLTELEEPAARDVVAAVEAAYQTLEAARLFPVTRGLLVVASSREGWYDDRRGGEPPTVGDPATWNVPDALDEFPLPIPALTDEGGTLLLSLRTRDPRGNVARPANLTARERAAIVRAVTGTLARAAIPSAPTWLVDGLGAYVGDVRVEGGVAHVGRPGKDVTDLERGSVTVSLRELLEKGPCDELEHDPWTNARWESFLLAHHLATSRADGLRAYLARLAAGEDPVAAWRATFPDLDPGDREAGRALERKLLGMGARREFTETTYPVEGGGVAVQRKPLACTDARLARLGVFTDAGLRQRLDSESRQLLVEVPGQGDARVARAELEAGPERKEGLQEAVKSAPESARGWALLAELLPAGPARLDAATRASALGGTDPAIEVRVAEARLAEGAVGQAVQAAKGVLAAYPWSVRGQLVVARGLARQGACEEAGGALALAERRYADRCPVHPDRDPLWQLERDRLHPLPKASLEAARAEVAACGGRTVDAR